MTCALALLPMGCAAPPVAGGPQQPENALRQGSRSEYCLTSPCIYVTSAYKPPSVDIYGADQRGAAKPIERIEGSSTGLSSPMAVAVDASHNVYVAGSSYYYQSVVTVYPAGYYGNVAPAQTITGPGTQMGTATGLAVDAAGNIYVTNWFAGSPCTGSVTVYAAGASGDVAPIAQIKGAKTGLCDPGGIAIDAMGDIYVTSGQQYGSSVNIYAAGSNGNVRPKAEISGRRTLLYDPSGVTLDSEGNVYVSCAGIGTLAKYRAGAQGNVRPLRAIYGLFTRLEFPYGIAVDPADRMFSQSTVRRDILVFARDATGDVPPIRNIRPNNRSDLRRPTNIAIR